MPIRALLAAASLIVALLASGCGVSDPYKTTTPAPAPDIAPAPAPSSAGASTAQAALRRFAEQFINWKFAQLPALKTRLAAEAGGALRAQLRTQAAQALTEVSRRVSNQANEGDVEAIAGPNRDGNYYIITHETALLGDAKAQPGYFLYLATVQRQRGRYVVTSFRAVS